MKMKKITVIRKVDSLNRVGIPTEIAEKMDIDSGDLVKFTVEDDGTIILQLYQKKL